MVVENNLSVVRRIDLSSCYIFIEFAFGININDFTIPFVSEKKARLSTSGIYLEVWWIVWCTNSSFPVVVAEISRFGD